MNISSLHLAVMIVLSIATIHAAPAAGNSTDAADVIAVQGRVLDPVGHAVAGAKVMTTAFPFESPLSQTVSGSDAAFTISFRKSKFAETWNPWQSTVVVATAPGFGPAWAKWDHADPAGNVVLTLATDDVPIEGRILDLEGRPVVDATVTVTSIRPKAVDLKTLNIDRSDPSEEPGDYQPDLNGLVLGAGQIVKTASDGRFHMTGLGRDRTVEIIVRGPGIANSYIEAITRQAPAQTKSFQSFLKVTETTYGATFDFTAAPGRAVSGTVRDAITHQPLAGVKIKTGFVRMEAVTDGQGRYSLDGFRKEQYAQITAVPTEQQPYLMCDADVPLMSGFGPITIDFNLHSGVVITGTVTDTSGRAGGGMEVFYIPYLTNKFAQVAPEFRKFRTPGRNSRYSTHADGTFHIVALPGPGLVMVTGGSRAYRTGVRSDQIKLPRRQGGGYQIFRADLGPDSACAIKEVDFPADQTAATVNLVCDPGITIHVRLVDSEGQPVVGAVGYKHVPGRPYERFKSANIDAVAFGPDEERTMFFFHKARRIGKIVTVRPSDVPSGHLEVKLEPFAKINGRLIGEDGQPIANASVGGFLNSLTTAGTDADGRFELNVVPGKEYNIGGIKGRDEFFTDVQHLILPPGAMRDLGDVHVRRS